MENPVKMMLYSTLGLLLMLQSSYSVPVIENSPDDPESNAGVILTVISILVVALGAVVLVFLCGGCTGMEVSSELHPASSSGHKSHGFDYAVTDANTRVMNSATTIPGDTYYPPGGAGDQTMPYSLNPPVPSAPGFAGYQQVPTSDPSQGWGGGYGQSQNNTAQGYGPSSPGPNAHRSPFDNEPPPPSYNDSINRGSDYVPYR